jgi:RHS repeat-associated protein
MNLNFITIIFLLLIFLTRGNFAVGNNQVSSASLGDLCALAVNSSSSRTTTDTYDANGNTTSSLITDHGSLGTNASDIYSFDNKLIRRTTADGKTIDLTYNPDGHRLTKFITQNGLTQRLVHYLTDANNPTGYAQVIEEKDPLEASNNQLNKVHLYGHDLISSLITDHSALITEPIFYTYDGLGSVRSISNATGDLQETYDYDAYGTLIGLNKRNASTGGLESLNTENFNLATSSYLFTGEQYDSDLQMYFLRARYLNTNTGRFHSQDTYEGNNGEPLTLHKYLYCGSNPISNIDPSGNFLVAAALAGSLTLDLGTKTVDAQRSVAMGAALQMQLARVQATMVGAASLALGALILNEIQTSTEAEVEEFSEEMRKKRGGHFFAHGTSDEAWSGGGQNIEQWGNGDLGPGFYTSRLPGGIPTAMNFARRRARTNGGIPVLHIYWVSDASYDSFRETYRPPYTTKPTDYIGYDVIYGPIQGMSGTQHKFQSTRAIATVGSGYVTTLRIK